MSKKLKELNFPVGNTADSFPSIGGRRSADSTFSSYMSRTFTDEDKFSEEDEVEDNILRKRVKVNGAYNLDKTLDRLDEFLDIGDLAGDAVASVSRAGKGLTKIIRDAGKSLVGAIPVVDIIFGSYRLAQLAQTIRDFSEKVSETMNKPKGYFGDALKSDSDRDWLQLIQEYALLTKEDSKTSEEVKKLFDSVLENLKDFIITLIEAYDTIAATVITLPTGGTLTLPAIGFGNIGTGLTGFAARTIPFERVLFSGGGYIAEGLKTILDLFLGESEHSATIEQMSEEGSLARVQKSFRDIESKGGSIMSAFLFSPVETLGRLNEFYRTTGDPSLYLKGFEQMIAEDRKYSILFLLEGFDEGGPASTKKYDDDPALKGGQSKLPDALQKGIINKARKKKKKNEIDYNEEESFEEIELEASGAGAVGGYALPLGASNKTANKRKDHHRLSETEKAINEQRERIALLQAYHQKTTNRLK